MDRGKVEGGKGGGREAGGGGRWTACAEGRQEATRKLEPRSAASATAGATPMNHEPPRQEAPTCNPRGNLPNSQTLNPKP